MNANSRSTCVHIVWHKYLNSLEKLIFPMSFLETDDVIVLGKPSEVVVFFPGRLRKKWVTFHRICPPIFIQT